MKSLSTSQTDYVALQIRALDTTHLHIQGSGPETNRGYGVAVTLDASPEVCEYISSQHGKLKSLADSSARYVSCQAANRGGAVHFQVAGTKKNREYGAVFNGVSQDLATFIQRAVQAEKTAAAKAAQEAQAAKEAATKAAAEFAAKAKADADKAAAAAKAKSYNVTFS